MAERDKWALAQEIDHRIDEFFADICMEYGIVIYNLNELDWDFK